MDVYARESDDGARTAVQSALVHIFARETHNMLKVVNDASVIAHAAIAPDVTHNAVDSDRALGGKIMVMDVVGHTM